MSDNYKIIQKLETVSGRLDKEAIIAEELTKENLEFFKGVELALDSMLPFGLKQIPIKELEAGDGLDQDDFIDVVNKLISRDLTGNLARDTVDSLMNRATKSQWNDWYRRILIKDLRCGVSDKTINKVISKNTLGIKPINSFEVQLAQDSSKHEGKLVGEKLVDVKLDGCLSSDWEVEFEDGSKVKIKEVVDKRMKGKIKCYDTINGVIDYKEVVGWACDGYSEKEPDYSWYELELGNGKLLPPLTGNHLVYLPKLKCYRRVDLLKEGDVLLCVK